MKSITKEKVFIELPLIKSHQYIMKWLYLSLFPPSMTFIMFILYQQYLNRSGRAAKGKLLTGLLTICFHHILYMSKNEKFHLVHRKIKRRTAAYSEKVACWSCALKVTLSRLRWCTNRTCNTVIRYYRHIPVAAKLPPEFSCSLN